MRIYLDACCISRLTDDQAQSRIQTEAEAIEKVFAGVRRGTLELISSEALADEVRRNPFADRRIESEALLSFAKVTLTIDDKIAGRALALVETGYGPYDALHLAAAESAGVDALLTTDDRFLLRVSRGLGDPRIPVKNPVSWVQEHPL